MLPRNCSEGQGRPDRSPSRCQLAAQPRTTLQDDGTGAVRLHHLRHDRLEQLQEHAVRRTSLPQIGSLRKLSFRGRHRSG